jgi:uncharacterized LabA/DUF88 family protein
MRTFVYIDGFNLYYRALKGSPYKWLDLKSLSAKLLQSHNRIVEMNAPSAPLTDPPRFSRVIKTEEKGSDVNLAVHLLNDAWLDKYDCAVIISNDSDLAEAIRLIRAQTDKLVGIISPIVKGHPSRELQKHAHFVKRIRTGVLRASQLPNPIPGTRIHKPDSW